MFNLTDSLLSLLYGRSANVASLNQTVNNLVAGKPYTLQYFYNVVVASSQNACTLTTYIRDQAVDVITSPNAATSTYMSRSVIYNNAASGPAVVSFVLACPANQNSRRSDFALDAITMTNRCS